MFNEARDHIGLSKTLVTIKTDIPLETTLDEMRLDRSYDPSLADLFEKYEFFSLKKYIAHIAQSAPVQEAPKGMDVRTVTLSELSSLARRDGRLGLAAESYGEGLSERIHTLWLSVGEAVCSLPGGDLAKAKSLLEDASIEKYGYDLKGLGKLLAVAGIRLEGRWRDIALMHYLVNPERSHDVDILAKSYLGVSLETGGEAVTGSLFDDTPEDSGDDRSREAAVLVVMVMLVVVMVVVLVIMGSMPLVRIEPCHVVVVVLVIMVEHHVEIAGCERAGHHTRDTDLVALEREGRKRGAEPLAVCAEVEQGGHQHVAGDAGRALEVERLRHGRSFQLLTRAWSMSAAW